MKGELAENGADDDIRRFRRSAREWLAAHAEPRPESEEEWGVGSDSVAIFHDLNPDEQEAMNKAACEWQRLKFTAGWGALTWPQEFGGRGLPSVYEHAFGAEEAHFVVPQQHDAFTATLQLMAPTVATFGTTEQKQHFIPAFLRADVLCCQLFSEPDAGSDLASLKCRAAPDGDAWLIDGQKVWTSGAQLSAYGLLIARSDTAVVKHRGLTAFLIPLDAEGIEIRPIRQMTGGAAFNEVFFSGVRIPDAARLGDVGEGWRVALTTLGFERGASADGAGGVGGSWERVLGLARHLALTDDLVMRQELARLYTRTRIGELTGDRARGALRAGQDPGALGSIGKLFWTQTLTATSEVVARLLGPRLVADTGEWGTFAWREHVLGAPGYRIAGGSDEIQRNIIGEKVLGLPREPREQR